MMKPKLLMSPEGSFIETGPVPVTVGPTTTITDGKYGLAWNQSVRATSTHVYIAHDTAGLTPERGTAIIRFRPTGEYPGSTEHIFALGVNGGAGRWLAIAMTFGSALHIATRVGSGTAISSSVILIEREVDHTAILSWEDGFFSLTCNGETVTLGDVSGEPWSNAYMSANRFNSNLPLQGYVESILTFAGVPDQETIDNYVNMDARWSWGTTFAQFISPAVPMVKSGLSLIETKVYESDMFGNQGPELSNEVVECKITSDIDRAGSKNRVDVSVVGDHEALPSGEWITVFQEISKENEGTQRVQRGVFELGQPTTSSAGANRYAVANSGNDVVDLLARSALLDTFYTPPKGDVMGDVALAIRMLGITSMGPNKVSNGSFEQQGTGWTFSAGGGASGSVTDGYFSGDASYPVADGKLTWGPILASTTPAGGYAYIVQDIALSQSDSQLMVSFMQMQGHSGKHYAWASVRFSDANGAMASSFNIDTERTIPQVATWTRRVNVGDVPSGAISAKVYIFAWSLDASPAGQVRELVDDVQVRAVTGGLLPSSLLALPASSARASNRIQHITSDTRLKAVNDRLAALGMMAVNATPDSKYTSRPARDPVNDAAVRTYNIDTDIRMIGDIQTERSTSNQYNRVFAIKEDFASGTSTVAYAENTNVDDKWSVHYKLLEPKIIAVQDAVSVDELKILAEAELAKASVQESVQFGLMPDPALTVYDIIAIEGPVGHPAVGKWAVESIESGLTSRSPLMRVGARRTITGG